jgi:hypothetical protein
MVSRYAKIKSLFCEKLLCLNIETVLFFHTMWLLRKSVYQNFYLKLSVPNMVRDIVFFRLCAPDNENVPEQARSGTEAENSLHPMLDVNMTEAENSLHPLLDVNLTEAENSLHPLLDVNMTKIK